MNTALLTSRGLLAISGEDRFSFLQGLVTSNIARVEKGEMVYAALLTPQGKFLHELFIVPDGERVLIDCEKSRVDDLRKRLTMYRLRSKVEIEEVVDMQVMMVWDGTISVPESLLIFADPRLKELGIRLYGKAEKLPEATMDEMDYHRMRLVHGVPDGNDLIPEKSFLLEWGFDQLGGVDYEKGCYVGQEVTARTHYRGQVRKAPYQVKTENGNDLPSAGEVVFCGETKIGELRSSRNDMGMALLRIEEVQKSRDSGMPLRIGDDVIEAQLPKWYSVAA